MPGLELDPNVHELTEILKKARRYNALAFFFMNQAKVPRLSEFVFNRLHAVGLPTSFDPATMEQFDQAVDVIADAVEEIIAAAEENDRKREQESHDEPSIDSV